MAPKRYPALQRRGGLELVGGLTYPPTLPLDGPGCINNVLINALQNLTL